MTLELLLGCSAKELESYTDEQLHSWASKYFHVTRPSKDKQHLTHPEKIKTTKGVKLNSEAMKLLDLFKETQKGKV